MAIRQYIGARYVPRFLGTYDATQVYEALDVVDNGLGTSYISKIPTPAGTPLTDKTHWAVYGAQSGAYISLQNQIDTINNTDIPGLQGQIDTINNTNLPAINSDIHDLQNRRIALITDSYGAIAGSTLEAEIEDAFKMPVDMHAVSAMGFVRDAGGRTFIDLLDDFDADNIPYYDYLIVYGGINDYVASDYTEEYNAVNSFIARAKTLFTNSKIVIFGPQSTPTGNIATNNNQAVLKRAIQSACSVNGISYADATNWLTLAPTVFSSNYLPDNTHPSALGYKIIASRMLRHLFGDCGNEAFAEILYKTHAEDHLYYTVNNNVINFTILTAARTQTQNVFDTFFTFNPIYKPFVVLHVFEPFRYYNSDYFWADGKYGSFQVNGNNGGRFLPKETTADIRIGVTGSIILFPEECNTVSV